MTKRIKKINVTSDKKGTVKNPYTVEEHEQMLNDGLWTEDGFVEELGLVEGELETNPEQMGDDYYCSDGEDNEEYHTYTRAEAQEMMDNGTWAGGFVEGYGYVMPDITNLPNLNNYQAPSPSGLDILNRARSFSGTRYLSGGMDKNGMDCSGLITAACNLSTRWTTSSGDIPGYTKTTYNSTTSYSSFEASLNIGDILVWPGRHAAIYEGNGSLFHARGTNSSGCVQSTQNLESYWVRVNGYPKVYRK